MFIHSFIYMLTMADSALIQQSGEVVTDTVWPRNLKYLLFGPLQKNVANFWISSLGLPLAPILIVLGIHT